MAYLQITTACNMTCSHCCFSATGRGDRMNHEIFMAGLLLAERYGEFITIGGGEPTTHRHFFEFLGKAIEFCNQGRIEDVPMIITNGKVASKAHRLLDMVEDEKGLCVELSQDEWHDPIDPLVVQRFRAHDRIRRRNYGTSSAGIRTVNEIIPVGRAADPARGIPTSNYLKCCCETWLVDPKGDVWSCGCKHTKLGTVWDSDVLDNYDPEYAHFGGVEPTTKRQNTLIEIHPAR